jgi:hypothetical protein
MAEVKRVLMEFADDLEPLSESGNRINKEWQSVTSTATSTNEPHILIPGISGIMQ